MTLSAKTILIMEDNPVLGLQVAFALEDEGATVTGPIARLEAGLAMIDGPDSANPDAAVLDVELADGEVFPLAERLRERGVPFVFYTARGSEGHMRARAGEAPVVSKTHGSAQVIEALNQCIADGDGTGASTPNGSATSNGDGTDGSGTNGASAR